jgi:transposase
VKVVADALDIHPFMLSRWRKQSREGLLRPKAGEAVVPTRRAPRRSEVRRLQELEREHRLLQEEHALLEQAFRFCSAPRPKRSRYTRPCIRGEPPDNAVERTIHAPSSRAPSASEGLRVARR